MSGMRSELSTSRLCLTVDFERAVGLYRDETNAKGPAKVNASLSVVKGFAYDAIAEARQAQEYWISIGEHDEGDAVIVENTSFLYNAENLDEALNLFVDRLKMKITEYLDGAFTLNE